MMERAREGGEDGEEEEEDGGGLLGRMIDALVRGAERPPKEVRGVSDGFLDGELEDRGSPILYPLLPPRLPLPPSSKKNP